MLCRSTNVNRRPNRHDIESFFDEQSEACLNNVHRTRMHILSIFQKMDKIISKSFIVEFDFKEKLELDHSILSITFCCQIQTQILFTNNNQLLIL